MAVFTLMLSMLATSLLLRLGDELEDLLAVGQRIRHPRLPVRSAGVADGIARDFDRARGRPASPHE
jgi:hypothetical protein